VARVVALNLDYPCAERLKPALVSLTRHLERQREVQVALQTLEHLGQVSVSTLKRMLKRLGRIEAKLTYRKLPRRPRPTLRHAYPMRRIVWDVVAMGHFEVDLVVHGNEETSFMIPKWWVLRPEESYHSLVQASVDHRCPDCLESLLLLR